MSRIVALVVVAVVLLSGVVATEAALKEGGNRYDVGNETWTADPGNITTLEHSNVQSATYDDDPLVVTQDGTLLVEQVDYEWYPNNGTVRALEGGSLSSGDKATIDYTFRVPNDQQQAFVGLFAGMFDITGVLVFAMGLAVMLGALRVFAS